MMPQLLAHLFGDYILQSDWMAQNKTKRNWPAFVHALLYALCFVPLCWVSAQHIAAKRIEMQPTRVIISQAATTAINIDGSYKEPAQDIPGRFHLLAWLVIFSTHFLIDRYRLARYVVWAKNWLGAPKVWIHTKAEFRGEFGDNWHGNSSVYTTIYQEPVTRINAPLRACDRHGYANDSEPWMSVWLLIIADNTLHLTINYLALRYL